MPKRKPKADDTAQAERFKATARELGTDESPEAFDRLVKKAAPNKASKPAKPKP